MSYSVAYQIRGKRTVAKYVVFNSTSMRNVGTRYKTIEEAQLVAKKGNKRLTALNLITHLYNL